MVDIGEISEIKNSRFEWTIHDFFSYTEENSEYFSPEFFSLDSWWYLKFYPNGTEDFKDYVGIYLFRISEDDPKDYEYRIGIKSLTKTIECERVMCSTFDSEVGWGFNDFLKKSDLLRQKSVLSPQDILTVTCFVKVKNSDLDLESSHKDLANDFKNLLISKEHSDVTFQVNKEELFAHRSILAARSPVFSAMFRNETLEKKTGIVKIFDFDPQTFSIFLHFLYCGEVDFLKCNVCELYKVSDKYDLPKLKSNCVDFMAENLSVENFCEILILSHNFEENELLTIIQKFFNENFEKIVSSGGWELLLENNFRLANSLLKAMAPKVKIV